MKPTPPTRPSPRTLAAPPPVALRVPRPAESPAPRLPPLAALLAAAVAPGCAEPVCAATRADEVESHLPRSVRALRDGEATSALRELGIALGLQRHRTTRTAGMEVGGAAHPVDPTPRVQIGRAHV